MHDQEEDRRMILLEYTAQINDLNAKRKEEKKTQREEKKAQSFKHKDIA